MHHYTQTSLSCSPNHSWNLSGCVDPFQSLLDPYTCSFFLHPTHQFQQLFTFCLICSNPLTDWCICQHVITNLQQTVTSVISKANNHILLRLRKKLNYLSFFSYSLMAMIKYWIAGFKQYHRKTINIHLSQGQVFFSGKDLRHSISPKSSALQKGPRSNERYNQPCSPLQWYFKGAFRYL